MKFAIEPIYRDVTGAIQPCEGAIKEIETDRDRETYNTWYIKINTLEELLQLSDKYGGLKIGKPFGEYKISLQGNDCRGRG